jgi:hypothetical protein
VTTIPMANFSRPVAWWILTLALLAVCISAGAAKDTARQKRALQSAGPLKTGSAP